MYLIGGQACGGVFSGLRRYDNVYLALLIPKWISGGFCCPHLYGSGSLLLKPAFLN